VEIENKDLVRIPELSTDCQVLVVSGDPSSPSHTYRVDNFVSGFLAQGVVAQWVDIQTLRSIETLTRNIRLVIFWRTNLDLSDIGCMQQRSKGTFPKVVYDIDDITFDPEVYTLANVDGLNSVGRTEREFLLKTLTAQQSKQITQSDAGIAPTRGIAKSYSKYGLKSDIVPIVIPRWMQKQAETTSLSNPPTGDSGPFALRIVYASGSKSHGVDFQSAWGALKKFLASSPNSTLTVIGHSPIDEADVPPSIRRSVNFVDFLKHEELISNLAEFNLQIAPVEAGNPFVEGKSATKFMQGAAIGLPTIASPAEAFREVVNHGRNGWLAETEEDWTASLNAASDSATWHAVSAQAKKDYLSNHTVDAIIEPLRLILDEAKNEFSRNVEQSQRGQEIKQIVWVLPDLPAGSGGHRNVLRFANFLPKSRYKCKVLILNSSQSDVELMSFVSDHYGFMGFEVTSDRGVVDGATHVFGTHHSTVDFVKKYSPANAATCYLVQDFESYFYPMSAQYLHALDSYFDTSLNVICSGPWMSGKIKELTGRSVPYFDFPVSRAIYNQDTTGDRAGVVFFAKADTPRRLFDLGIQSLRLFRMWNPGVGITLFGGSATQMREFENEFNVLGRLDTIEELGDLYRKSAVGMVFSTTNPSLVPYEMMACGLPVVDVAVRTDVFSKYGTPPVAVLAEANATSIALKLTQLIADRNLRVETSEKAMAFVDNFPDEVDTSVIMSEFIDGLK
jgi:glycosyltransferase involved in cell wall biosynthesis